MRSALSGLSAIPLVSLALGLGPPAPVADTEADAPDGLLVLAVLSPERALVADPRNGATRARRLAGGTLCHGPLIASGGRVLLAGSRARRAVALSLPLSLRGRARLVGAGWSFTPSATPGRLWMLETRGRPGARPHAALELGLDGRVHGRYPLRLPGWAGLEGAVEGAILVRHRDGLTVWDPVRRRSLRELDDGWVVAAGGSRFAYCRGECRRLRLWSPDGETIVRPPRGTKISPADAAFSPDGSRLAIGLSAGRRSRLATLDLPSGRWRLVPGGALSGYGAVAWSPSGQWLYFTGAGQRLWAWREGSDSSIRLPLRTGGIVMSIATTAPLTDD